MTAGSRRARHAVATALGAWITVTGGLAPFGLGGAGVVAAHAQSSRYRPPPEDHDAEEEQRSTLWERAIHSSRDEYDAMVERAVALIARRDAHSDADAEQLLADAIALAPDVPHAHWHLGEMYRSRERWTECTDALARLYDLDRDYTPASAARRPATPGYELAVCAARSGQYERAVGVCKRILRRGVTGNSAVYAVYWQLGEAYMALGRLEEAIAALTTGAKLASAREVGVRYALAVAYDRDEQESRARRHMLEALGTDANMSQLEGPSLPFAPPADQQYYLGLASATLGKPDWAIAYFRHYLHAAGDAPWARRARDHIARLVGEPIGAAVEFDGSARPGEGMRDAVAAVAANAQQCGRDTPGLLVELRVTAVVGRASRSRARGRRGRVLASGNPVQGQAPGVRAKVAYASATKADEVEGVLACVERAAESASLPAPVGTRGQFLITKFFVIAR